MKKIFIATSSFATFSSEPIDLLKSNGIEVKLNDKGRKLTEEEIIDALHDFDGVIAGTEPYNKKVISSLEEFKIISRLGVGMDNVDLDFARKKNIRVNRTSTSPSLAVSELVIGLILDLLRKISYQNDLVKVNKWSKKMGSLLSGKTIGIVGLGTIGKTVVELTQGFGLKYIAFDRQYDTDFSDKHNLTYVSLDELLKESDIITVHLSLSKEVKNLFSTVAFDIMKNDAILINTSRGEIIDEKALESALNSGDIGGAGLDVFSEEPYNGPLLKLDNIVTTPHIGGYAKEIRMRMELEAANNIVSYFNEQQK